MSHMTKSLYCIRLVATKGLATNNGEGGGGYKTGRGGGTNVLAKLKGGHTKFWGSFYAVA